MQKSKIKYIAISLLFGLVTIIGIALYMYNKPHVNVTKAKADIKVTSQKILANFELDETEANKIYLEKIVEVTGIVSDISMNKETGIVAIESEEAMGSVLCHLSASETKKIKTLKKGTKITVKGICTGYLMDVILVKSVIKN